MNVLRSKRRSMALQLPAVIARLLAVGRPGRRGLVVLIACLVGYLGSVAAAGAMGFDLWRQFGVPTASPSFLDTRVIVSGWECTRDGLDVLAENPCDPWQRPVNYPRIWMVVAPLGLDESSAVPLGLTTGAVFLLAALVLVGRLNFGTSLLYAAVLLSPAVMFGVDRGNNDLVIFALLVAALAFFRTKAVLLRAACYSLFLLAAVLKLYPAFAFSVLLRQAPRRAALAVVLTLVPFALYVVATLDDLRLIRSATPRPVSLAYGAGVLVDGAGERLGGLAGASFLTGEPGRVAAYLAALVLALALAFWLAGQLGPIPPRTTVDRTLDAFWAGASVYIGTFAVLGNNWDYRLLFLLLVIPQMLRWTQGVGPLSTISTWALLAIVGTLWLSPWLPRLPFSLPLDEALNWLLFVYLAAGLVLTRPRWLTQGYPWRPRPSQPGS
jgi:hypothetical protein